MKCFPRRFLPYLLVLLFCVPVLVGQTQCRGVTATVPDCIGMTQPEAALAVFTARLAVGAVMEVHSIRVAPGRIAAQSPAAGTEVSPGSLVYLGVSKGPGPLLVPDCVGHTRAAAEAILAVVGLQMGDVTEEYNASVPADTVMAQDPVAGTEVSAGTAVALHVSLGPRLVTVPDVTGMARPDAHAAIQAAELTVGTETTEFSSTVPVDEVTGQSPAAGTVAPPGSAVALTMSRGRVWLVKGSGPAAKHSPPWEGLTWDTAFDEIQEGIEEAHAGGGAAGALDCGGGMYNDASSPEVTNCTFVGNSVGSHGGGMYNSASSPCVTNCVFMGNSAYSRGGGMYNNASSPEVTNCTFDDNDAGHGGGMYNENGSSPIVLGCTFTGHDGVMSGGRMYNQSSSPTVTDCAFTENNVRYGGGGLYDRQSTTTIVRCTFVGNTADTIGGGYGGHGGGIESSVSTTDVTHSVFTGNWAYFGGGGMSTQSAVSSAVVNCVFAGNTADYNGGGIYTYYSSTPIIVNCTFTSNEADVSGGGAYNHTASPTFINCIFWDDTAPSDSEIGVGYSASPTVAHCCVEGGHAGGTDIVTDPPLFFATGDLRLQTGSSCIDAGADTYGTPNIIPGDDIRGVARPQGDHVDIGAYEMQPGE